MSREIIPPTKNERDEETHPAFGMISAHRGSTSKPGATLYDSDIQHNFTVSVRIATGSRKCDLNHDWTHREKEFVEVEMSEAQWASFVSSMNSGSGVPCTIRRREDDWDIPGLPYEPRLAESMAEVKSAGDKAFAQIREAFKVAQEKPTKSNMRSLQAAIENSTPNMTFAASSLSEHAENVVQRARADFEAMVASKARQLGMNPEDLDMAPQLGSGDAA